MPDPQQEPTGGSPVPVAPSPVRPRTGPWKATAIAGPVLVLGLAGLGLTAVGASARAERPGAPDVAATSRGQDTVPDGDLRCLTRRSEDCLDAPVPADEPHGAVCATCHDLWDQEPGAVRSCTDAGCHETPSRLATFHGTVDLPETAACTDCHPAHGFRVPDEGRDCRVCHQGGGTLPSGYGPAGPHPADVLDFGHDDHTAVACTSCHGTGESHTAVRVDGRGDCRSCHHDPGGPGGNDDGCLSCHVLDEVTAVSFTVERAVDIRIGALDRPRRLLPFDHGDHWANGCTACHTGGPDLGTAEGADCSGCHFQHHESTSTCSTCHETPASGAHDRDVHLGCGGAGCHDPVPPGLVPAPRTRSLCLACHADRADHQPEGTCADCHLLPEPRGSDTVMPLEQPEPER